MGCWSFSICAAKAHKTYLIISLDVSDQDGEVLNPEVDVIVDMLVDTLVCWPWISKKVKARIQKEWESKEFSRAPTPCSLS